MNLHRGAKKHLYDGCPCNRLYIVFFRKDTYTKDDVKRFRFIVKDPSKFFILISVNKNGIFQDGGSHSATATATAFFFAAVGWLEFELANQHKSYRKLSIHLFSHMKQEKVFILPT